MRWSSARFGAIGEGTVVTKTFNAPLVCGQVIEDLITATAKDGPTLGGLELKSTRRIRLRRIC
jgi:hypothetical protein